ncbi:MAG: tyrosine-type recombinase/integrase [Planctomycetota bacterium]
MAKREYKPTRYPNVFWRGESLYYRFRMPDRKVRTVRVGSGATPKEAARAQQEAQDRADAIRQGIIDPVVAAIQDHERQPIESVIDEFEKYLRAKKNTEAWIGDKVARIHAWREACEVRRMVDADPVRLTNWLATLDDQGKAAATRNKYRSSVLSLLTWAVAHGRLGVNRCPSALIPVANEEADQRRTSRAMTAEQVAALLAVAPHYRRLIYILGASTAIRWGEISRLTWRDVDLDAGFVIVPARASKNRREAELPLSAFAVDALQEYRSLVEDGRVMIRRIGQPGLGPDDLIVGMVPAHLTWQKDLARAGIVGPAPEFEGYRDAAGNVYDRKCLRTTFGTLMSDHGVDVRNLQKLMRHSSIELTARFYSRARLVQLEADVATLGDALTRAGRAQGRTNGNNVEQNETSHRDASSA